MPAPAMPPIRLDDVPASLSLLPPGSTSTFALRAFWRLSSPPSCGRFPDDLLSSPQALLRRLRLCLDLGLRLCLRLRLSLAALAFAFGLGFDLGFRLGLGLGRWLAALRPPRASSEWQRPRRPGSITARDTTTAGHVHGRHQRSVAPLESGERMTPCRHSARARTASSSAEPATIGRLDVHAATLHAVLPEDQVDATGTHVHALHGVPAEQRAVEREGGFVVGGRELVPRERAQRRRDRRTRAAHSPGR